MTCLKLVFLLVSPLPESRGEKEFVSLLRKLVEVWAQELNINFFINLSGHPRDIPAKIPEYPAKSLIFLRFEGIPNFLVPIPSRGRPSTPPEETQTQKFESVLFFLPEWKPDCQQSQPSQVCEPATDATFEGPCGTTPGMLDN